MERDLESKDDLGGEALRSKTEGQCEAGEWLN